MMTRTRKRVVMGMATCLLLTGMSLASSRVDAKISIHFEGGYQHHSSHHHHGLHYGRHHRSPGHDYAGHVYGCRSYYYQHPYPLFYYACRYPRTQEYVVYGGLQPATCASISRYTVIKNVRGNDCKPQTPGKNDPDRIPQSGQVSHATPGHRPLIGWRHLIDASYEEALTHFGIEAQARPECGAPKVGYALASAIRGQLYRGIWSMRRAFQANSNGVRNVGIEDSIHRTIENLIVKYEYPIKNIGTEEDTMFIVAALRFLIRDLDEGQITIDATTRAGDVLASTTNLKLLIAQGHQGADVDQTSANKEPLIEQERADRSEHDY